MNNVLNVFENRNLDPFYTMTQLHREMDSVLRDFMNPTKSAWRNHQETTTPVYDVEEANSYFLLSIDLPGVPRDQIQIEVVGNHLKIIAERNKRYQQKNSSPLESQYRRWEQSFILPQIVQTDRIETNYEEGVLRVAIPKVESEKPRQIKIHEERSGLFGKLLGQSKDKKTEVEVRSEKVASLFLNLKQRSIYLPTLPEKRIDLCFR